MFLIGNFTQRILKNYSKIISRTIEYPNEYVVENIL